MIKRVRITQAMRVRIFEKHEGICHICDTPVFAGQAWDVSHDIPLEAGGKDDPSNWFVAHHSPCHVNRTKTDMKVIVKTRRMRAKHIGAKKSKSPMAFGKDSPYKRKMDGTIVKRDKT